jgi:LmbE family N-acetylglucosaminyl deacetylase
MRTDLIVAEPVVVFFFAHQDDEFAVFHLIEQYRRRCQRVLCAYLTEAAAIPGLVERRNAESMHVLTRLGVAQADVIFAGSLLSIVDASLPDQLPKALGWANRWLDQYTNIVQMYVPAWEGGHHDHDGLHAIVLEIAARRGLLPHTRQFSLYHGYRCPGPFFKVLAPLAANGAVESEPISLAERWRYLRLCLSYPSQARTWIGLFPFVCWHYIRWGRQMTQAVSKDRLTHQPHPGSLYYERRRFYTWEKMQRALRELQSP